MDRHLIVLKTKLLVGAKHSNSTMNIKIVDSKNESIKNRVKAIENVCLSPSHYYYRAVIIIKHENDS